MPSLFGQLQQALDGFNRWLDQRLTPAVKALLLLNVGVYLALVLTAQFDRMLGRHLVEILGQTPARSWYMPWQFVTYQFVHAGVFHLFFNMLALWFFGPPLEMRWGTRAFWRFYLIAGIGAGVGHALLNHVAYWGARALELNTVGQAFDMYIPVVGASGAVFAILLAFAAYHPEQPVLLMMVYPVKIKYLVIGLAVMEFVAMSAESNVSHLTHLCGLAAGYVVLARRHRDWDIRTWRWRD